MAKVDLESIKPNSHSYNDSVDKRQNKQEREKLKPIVSSDAVVTTKTPLVKKIASRFIKTDATDIKSYLISEVIIPGLQNAILDSIAMMFGKSIDSRDRDRRRGSRTDYRSSYKGTDYSSRSKSRDRDDDRYREDDKVDYRNIILRDRRDAEDIVNALYDTIDKDGQVTIAELLELVGESSEFTDLRWGWTSTRDIKVTRVRSGYLIDVDRARYLDE